MRSILNSLIKICIVLTLLLLLFPQVSPANEPNPVILKIMTLNLHNGIDTENQSNFESFAALVAAEQPDIIALQEVQSKHLKYLRIPGYQAISGPNANCISFRFGNALLTRHKIIYHRHHYLPSQKEQRGVDEVAIAINGQYLRVLNTHIGLGYHEQMRQINEISRISDYLSGPLIIAGDFNLEPGHQLLAGFKFTEVSAGFTPYKTYPSKQPKYHIDQIWHNEYFQVQEARPVLWPGSDHYPVVAVMALTTPFLSINQPAIPDLTLQYNPLLPDVGIHPVKADLGAVFLSSAYKWHGSLELSYENRYLLAVGCVGNEPELAVSYVKTIDLRDYFSYCGMRGKAEWNFSAATNLKSQSWLEWGQYYRWNNSSGSKIRISGGEQKPDWSLEQYYLPAEHFRLMIGYNADSTWTAGVATVSGQGQVIQLQYIHGLTGDFYRLNWECRF